MASIRHADIDDIPYILEIYNDAIINTTAVYAYEPYNLKMMQDWYLSKVKNNFPVCVAIHKSTIVGFSALDKFRLKPAYQYTVENSIFVHPKYRIKGIGSQLLTDIISRAKKLNKHTIIAGIDSTNTASVVLHQNHGFQTVANFPQIGYKFDRWLDLSFMQLILDNNKD